MVELQRETLSDQFIAEVEPLLSAHFKEVGLYDGGQAEPDWIAYRAMETSGSYVVYTARKKGELVGYIGFTLGRDPHCVSMVQALQDLLYIAPGHRGRMTSVRLIRYADDRLQALGVDRVLQTVPYDHDYSPILERVGYKPLEKTLIRSLN